ncbi:MAG: glucosamine-6-phosphate deaminase [Erysipelotrichaceae bacterium]|nr:glucosamine-6-phosphate deaminase [Erysipelotrichaceae bacterium]
MKIIRVKNYEEASEKAYEVMKEFIKPGAVLGLATGSTPLGLYALMVKDHEENGTDYSQIRTFNLDEYVGLPLHHRESYYSFMHTNLFNKVGIPEENTHVPGGLGDLEANCKAYDEMLAKESVDIQLLGIGADGHIGFNEPGTPFNLGTHVTDLTEQTRKDNQRFFNDLGEETPTQAVTMGPATIMAAKNVLLIATGENKAEAIKGMIEGPVSEECQASLLQNHPSCTVIIDEGAGKLLENH